MKLPGLHGFRTSGDILRRQLSKWGSLLHELFDVVRSTCSSSEMLRMLASLWTLPSSFEDFLPSSLEDIYLLKILPWVECARGPADFQKLHIYLSVDRNSTKFVESLRK